MSEQIDIKFENRNWELDQLKAPSVPFKAISSPAGYGKSYLLKKLKEDLENNGWKCSLIDLDIDKGEKAIRANIAKQLGFSPADISGCQNSTYELKKIIAGIKQTVLLFDSVDRGDDRDIDWLLKFVLDCRKGAKSLDFLAYFAGRHLNVDDKARRWASFNVIELTPLTKDIVQRVLENFPKHHLSQGRTIQKAEFIEWADKIFRLSGGQPRSIKKLVWELDNSNWSLAFNSEEQAFLFDTYVSEELDEILNDLNDDIKLSINSISVFRIINIDILSALKRRSLLPERVQPTTKFIGELSGLGLIQKKDLFYTDGAIRSLVLARLKYSPNEQLKNLNKIAKEIYLEFIDQLLVLKSLPYPAPTGIPELLQKYIIEVLYYCFQLASATEDISNSIRKASDLLEKCLGKDEEDIYYRKWIESTIYSQNDLTDRLSELDISLHQILDLTFSNRRSKMEIDPETKAQGIKIILEAGGIIVDIVRGIFMRRKAQQQEDTHNFGTENDPINVDLHILPLEKPDEFEKILRNLNQTYRQTQIDGLKSSIHRLSLLNRNWNDVRDEELKIEPSAYARIQIKQTREDIEDNIKKEIILLKQTIEELTGQKIVLPPLDHFQD